MENIVKKKDFIELTYTGYENGRIFDSNIEEDFKQIHSHSHDSTSQDKKPDKISIVIGERMVVKGLDNSLEGKEIGKEYFVKINPEDGFGKRNPTLIKTIPLNVFTKQKITPHIGESFFMDNQMARVITISGARVITDFNHPLAGRDIEYKFKIERKLTGEKEKTEALLKFYLKQLPKFEIKENKIIIEAPKQIENFLNLFKPKFKELLNKELELKEEKIKEGEK
jgi:FKBP-type peptidyl-prolyl cis-trans isomerase 2